MVGACGAVIVVDGSDLGTVAETFGWRALFTAPGPAGHPNSIASSPASPLPVAAVKGGKSVDWMEPVSDAQYRG
jgi:hypothetical protein